VRPPLVIDPLKEVMSGVVERGLLADDVAVAGMCLMTMLRDDHDRQQSDKILLHWPIQVISPGSQQYVRAL
jgi:hypothetical protein